MFTAALFIIVKKLEATQMNKRINKLCIAKQWNTTQQYADNMD